MAAFGRLWPEGLELIAPASPKAVAIDVILADDRNPAATNALAAAMRKTPNVVLRVPPCRARMPDGRILFRFLRRRGRASVTRTREPDPVCREDSAARRRAGHDRRWALALEAYRAGVRGRSRHRNASTTSKWAAWSIPAPAVRIAPCGCGIGSRTADPPTFRCRTCEPNPALAQQFAGKTVFVGRDRADDAGDRLQTPYSDAMMPGVEIHAQRFRDHRQRLFPRRAPAWTVLAFCLALVALSV